MIQPEDIEEQIANFCSVEEESCHTQILKSSNELYHSNESLHDVVTFGKRELSPNESLIDCGSIPLVDIVSIEIKEACSTDQASHSNQQQRHPSLKETFASTSSPSPASSAHQTIQQSQSCAQDTLQCINFEGDKSSNLYNQDQRLEPIDSHLVMALDSQRRAMGNVVPYTVGTDEEDENEESFTELSYPDRPISESSFASEFSDEDDRDFDRSRAKRKTNSSSMISSPLRGILKLIPSPASKNKVSWADYRDQPLFSTLSIQKTGKFSISNPPSGYGSLSKKQKNIIYVLSVAFIILLLVSIAIFIATLYFVIDSL